jgi:hypothetical protein
MLSSIHPLGERSKGNRFGLTASAHILGAALGGALLGVLLGAAAAGIGEVLGERPRLVLALIAVAVAAGFELAGRRPPSWRRQVDEDWLTTYRGWVYGGGYGVQLGAAVVTIVTSPVTYAMVASALLVGSFAGAIAIAAAFGLARGLTILAGARVRDPQALVRLHRGMARAGAPVARAAAAGMAACALLIGGALAT